MKRVLTTITLLVMVLACVLAATSCGLFKGNHEHSYEKTATAPTCTEAGYFTYTCSCKDSYTEAGPAALGHDMIARQGHAPTCSTAGYYDYEECSRCGLSDKEEVAALGHSYQIQSITYPTLKEEGERTLKCTYCDLIDTQKIAASGTVLPQVSKLLGTLLGEISISANANEVVIVNGSKTTREDTSNYMNFVAVKLGEFSLETVDGLPKGYFKLELLSSQNDLADDQSFESVEAEYERLGEIYVYLNGEVISYEISGPDMETKQNEFELSAIFYQYLAASMGITEEAFNQLAYLAGEFTTVADDLMNLVLALNEVQISGPTDAYIETLNTLLTTLAEDVIKETSLPNGNTEYTTNVEALTALIDALDGKTFKAYVDEVMGEGTADKLREFAIGIPDMKISKIANFAIDFAEESGMSVDTVFSFVDLVIYISQGESISTKALVESYYNKTVAEVLEADAADLTANITSAIDQIYGYTFNYIFEQSFGGTFADLKDALEQIDDVAYLIYVLDAEGNFVSLHAEIGSDLTVDLSETAISIILCGTVDGEKVEFINLQGVIENGEIVSFTLDVNQIAKGFLDNATNGGVHDEENTPDEDPVVYESDYTYTLVDFFTVTYEDGTLVIDNGYAVMTVVTADDGNGNYGFDLTISANDEVQLAVDVDYSETYTEEILDAELTLKVEYMGLDMVDFHAVIDDDVLVSADLVINQIEYEKIWHEGYLEEVWIEEGYWDYVWNEDLGYYEETWVEDGYWSERYVSGYYEYTGEYYVNGTFEAELTNVDGVLTLKVGNGVNTFFTVTAEEDDEGLYSLELAIPDGPTFCLFAQQDGDGVRFGFELPAYIHSGTSDYAVYDPETDEYDYVYYDYTNYTAIIFDLYVEVK